MAFGLPTSSNSTGPFLGRLQYDAQEGLWTVVHRIQVDGRGRDEKENPFRKPLPSFLADFGSIEVGYIKFWPTVEHRLVPFGEPLPPEPDEMGTNRDGKPAKLFRAGIRMKLYAPKLFATTDEFGRKTPSHEAYWFSNTAQKVYEAIGTVWEMFIRAPEAAQGKVPLLTVTAVNEAKGGFKVMVPTFAITGWFDRPECFGERTVPAPIPEPASAGGVTMAPPKDWQPADARITSRSDNPPPNDDNDWGGPPTHRAGPAPPQRAPVEIDDDVVPF